MKPAKFLGIEDRYNGSKPTSPTMLPSRAIGRGSQGREAERFVLSTISFHFRGGIGEAELREEEVNGEVGVVRMVNACVLG